MKLVATQHRLVKYSLLTGDFRRPDTLTSMSAPPYTITQAILRSVERIGEALGRRSMRAQFDSPKLRRANRIRTLRGSLAIEGNTLSEDEIRTILEGKTVVAAPREIQEVRNAIVVYEKLLAWNPTDASHLLEAHQMMMAGLLDAPGSYRRKGAGVMGPGGVVIHVAPPANLVPTLMGNLLSWLADADAHPLIASCVFHYEFEFIHPFEDGNGRMGRLWQTAVLSRWKPVFTHLPIENMIFTRQEDYYAVLRECGNAGTSTNFIHFMLEIILDTLIETDQVSDQASDQVTKLLKALKRGPLSAAQIMSKLGLAHKPSFRQRYLRPALDAGLVEMTNPSAPNAANQKYRLPHSSNAILEQ